jgi:hypothetical protein
MAAGAHRAERACFLLASQIPGGVWASRIGQGGVFSEAARVRRAVFPPAQVGQAPHMVEGSSVVELLACLGLPSRRAVHSSPRRRQQWHAPRRVPPGGAMRDRGRPAPSQIDHFLGRDLVGRLGADLTANSRSSSMRTLPAGGIPRSRRSLSAGVSSGGRYAVRVDTRVSSSLRASGESRCLRPTMAAPASPRATRRWTAEQWRRAPSGLPVCATMPGSPPRSRSTTRAARVSASSSSS